MLHINMAPKQTDAPGDDDRLQLCLFHRHGLPFSLNYWQPHPFGQPNERAKNDHRYEHPQRYRQEEKAAELERNVMLKRT